MKRLIRWGLSLENGVDIKASQQSVIDEYVDLYDVLLGDGETLWYNGNCVPSEGNACPRKRFCGDCRRILVGEIRKRDETNGFLWS